MVAIVNMTSLRNGRRTRRHLAGSQPVDPLAPSDRSGNPLHDGNVYVTIEAKVMNSLPLPSSLSP